MTAPATRTATPAAMLVLFVFAGFWALAGLGLVVGLWRGPTTTTYGSEGGGIADNAAALTVLLLCLLGATVCAAAGAVVGSVSRRVD